MMKGFGNVPKFGVSICNICVKERPEICSASGSLALVIPRNKRLNMRAIASMKMVITGFYARSHLHWKTSYRITSPRRRAACATNSKRAYPQTLGHYQGFSLLEFLVATMLFLMMLVSGYQALDSQFAITRMVLEKTRPEQEANYRLIVLDGLLRDRSEKLDEEEFFQDVPLFFRDLQFGSEVREDAFSVVRLLQQKIPFNSAGSFLRIPISGVLQAGNSVLLAGPDESAQYDWTYAKIVKIVTQTDCRLLQLQYFLEKPPPLRGYLSQAEIHGFFWKDQTLYWISPAGQTAPFWGGLEQFSYEWNDPRLKLSWKTAESQGSFTSSL